MSDELTPITRTETFLAKAGGQSVETPTPITREETFLQAIIDNGSGGGGGTGGGGFVVALSTSDNTTFTLDKTWNEIKTAYDNKSCIQCHMDGVNNIIYPVTSITEQQSLPPLPSIYGVTIYDFENADILALSCSDPDEYPSVTLG